MARGPADDREQIAGYSDRGFTLNGAAGNATNWSLGGAVRVRGAVVSPSLFPLLRATPYVGRVFTSEEEAAGNNRVAILSYGAWQTRYGGAPEVIGALLTLDDVGYTVVGVMPEDFYFPNRDTELWVPLSVTIPQQQPGQRFVMAFSGIARLRDGVSVEQAEAEGQTIVGRQEPMAPGMGAATLRLIGLQEELVGEARPALLKLSAAVGFVLLIAAANLANLLLARGAARQRELAVRSAIGAGRGRLVRQLITESLTLSVAGGAVGLAAASLVIPRCRRGLRLVCLASATLASTPACWSLRSPSRSEWGWCSAWSLPSRRRGSTSSAR